MADIQSNIHIDIDTASAADSIKNLQRQISAFHSSLRSSGSAANAAISDNLQKNLVNAINATGKFAASMTQVKSSSDSFTEALEKNKLSMGQYFRYAGGATKTFGRLFRSEFDTIEKTARERVKTLQTQYIKMGRDANGAIQAIKVRPLALDMQNLGTQTQMAAQKQQIFNQLMKQGSTNLLNFGKNTQWAGRQLMVGFTVPMTMAATAAAKAYMDMEKASIKFKRVYGDMSTAAADTDKMADQIRQLAAEYTKYGVAVADTMGLAAEAAAMGKQGADLIAQVNNATRLAVLGGVEQTQALEATISVTNAFGVSADQLAGKIDFLNAVENQTVTSIEDLTIAIPKAGPVIQQLGGSVEDLAFFLTAMKEGGINASEGANALKSGIASLINPTSKATDMLAGFGINLKQIVEGNAGNIKETVVDFAEALNTLDPLNRARAIEQMFGKFQFARLSTLFQNITKDGTQASKVLELSRNSAEELAVLSEREMKRIESSPMYKFQKALEDIKTQLVPLGEEFLKMATPIIKFGTDVLKQFNSMDTGVKTFVMGAIAVLGGLAPVAIMAFGLVANGVANLIKGFTFVRNLFSGTSGEAGVLGSQLQYMSQEQLEAASAAASLGQSHANLIQQFTSEVGAVAGLTAAYRDQLAALVALNSVAVVPRSRPNTVTTNSRGGRRVQTNPANPGLPGYAKGIVSVPGPKGAGDVVPAMLAPGEAVIPADQTQKYGGLIAGIVADNIPGYRRSNVTVGGSTVSLGASTATADKIQAEAQNFLNNIGAQGSEILKEALDRLAKDVKIGVQDFRKELATVAEEKGIGARKTLTAIGMTPKQISKTRGASGAIGIEDQFKNERGAEGVEEFNRALAKSRKQYEVFVEELQKTGMSLKEAEIQATKITKFDPNDKKMHGLARGHIADVSGVDKMYDESFSSLGTIIDTQLENNFVSTMSTPGKNGKAKPTQNYEVMEKAAAEAVRAGQITEAERTKYLTNLMKNESLDHSAQKTQHAVLGQLLDNGTMYQQLDGNLKTRLDSMRTTAKAIRAGFNEIAGLPEMPGVGTRTPGEVGKFRTLLNAAKFRRRGYNSGVVSVPGRGNSDTVPAMLTPGESVIPAAESKKYAPLIAAMIDGKIPGFVKGRKGAKGGFNFGSTTDAFSEPNPFGGSGPLAPPTMDDPFGPSASFNFEPEKSGKELALGFARNLKAAAKEFGGVAGTAMKAKGKEIGKAAGNSLKDRLAVGLANTLGNPIELSGGRTYDPRDKSVTDEQGNVVGSKAKSSKSGTMVDEDGNEVIDPKSRKARRAGRMQRAGKMAGAMGGISMAVGMAQGVEGPVGQIASAIMPVVSGLSMLGPIVMALPGPFAALAAVIVGGFMIYNGMNDAMNKTRQSAFDLAESMGTGSKAMNKFAEFAGKATPTEVMDKRRGRLGAMLPIKAGKSTFGMNFFQADAGKQMLDSAKSSMATTGRQGTVDQFGLQLAQSVSQGILTKGQAADIALNLGQQLGDYTIATEISGKLVSILGPAGEDLISQPLKIQAEIQTKILDNVEDVAEEANTAYTEALSGYETFFGIPTGGFEELAKAEGVMAAGTVSLMQTQQASLDNYDLMYQKKIEQLKVDGKLVEAAQLQKEYDEGRVKILAKNASVWEQRVKILTDNVSGNGANGMFNTKGDNSFNNMIQNMEDAAKSIYKDSPNADKYNKAIEEITKDSGIDVKAKLTLTASMASGQIDPLVMDVFTKTFKGGAEDSPTYTALATVITKFGGAAGSQAIKLMDFFGDSAEGKTKKVTFMAKIAEMKPGEGQTILNTLTQISSMSGVVDIKAALEFYTKGDNLEKYMGQLKIINSLKDQGKLDVKTVISQIFKTDSVAANAMKENQKYFEGLDSEQKVTYLQTFIASLSTITDEQAKAEIIAESPYQVPASAFTPELLAARKAKMAAKAAWMVTEQLKLLGIGTGGGGGGGGGSKSGPAENMLDGIVKKIRDATKASLALTTGLKASRAALAALAKDSRLFTLADGLDSQLRGYGVGTELREAILGLSQEDLKKMESVIFTHKKGQKATSANRTGLTSEFKKINELNQGADIDMARTKAAQANKDIETKTKAYKLLREAGADATVATDLSADIYMAEAIAAGKSAEQIKELIRLKNIEAEANKQLAASQNLSKNADEYKARKNLSSILGQAKTAGIKDIGMQEIINNPDLLTKLNAQFMATGKVNFDDAEIKKALQLAVDKAALEATISKFTLEGMEKVFSDGMAKVNESFAAKQTQIELDFKLGTNLSGKNVGLLKTLVQENIIKAAQDDIDAIQNRAGGIDDLEAGLTRIGYVEEEVNKKYDEQYEALDKIEKANEAIANKEKSKLTLADALSRGDIAAAAAQMQQVRAEQAAQSVQNKRKALEAAKEKELKAITSEVNGVKMNRETIEKNLKTLQKEVFEIEEKKLEPAREQIRLATILKDAAIDAIDVLGNNRDAWDQIQNKVDMARINGEGYKKSIQDAIDIMPTLISKLGEVPALPTPDQTTVTTADPSGSKVTTAAPSTVTTTKPPVVTPTTKTVVVKSGDTLSSIAKANGTTLAKILSLNPKFTTDPKFKGGSMIWAGTTVKVPLASGGMVPQLLAKGGMPRIGTDTVPAMLTPGEFVVKKYAVDKFGADRLSAINSGTYSDGSVYNYNLSVNVSSSSASPDEIARTVMSQIQRVEDQRLKSNRFSRSNKF